MKNFEKIWENYQHVFGDPGGFELDTVGQPCLFVLQERPFLLQALQQHQLALQGLQQ